MENKSTMLFSEAIANVDKATRPGSPLCLQLVRSDPRLDTIVIQNICVIQELSLLLQFTDNILTIHNFIEIIINIDK